jgi:hypothetical protein
MGNPEKLATQGTQDEEKHNTICVGDMLLISANAIRLESTNVQISMVTKTYKRQI